MVEVKPKRQRVSSPFDVKQSTQISTEGDSTNSITEANQGEKMPPPTGRDKAEDKINVDNPVKSLLVAYETSDSEED